MCEFVCVSKRERDFPVSVLKAFSTDLLVGRASSVFTQKGRSERGFVDEENTRVKRKE